MKKYILLLIFIKSFSFCLNIQAQTNAFRQSNDTIPTINITIGSSFTSDDNRIYEDSIVGDYIYRTYIPQQIILTLPEQKESGQETKVTTKNTLTAKKPIANLAQKRSGVVSSNIDTNNAIGEIPIQMNVNNGALTYSVPIDVYSIGDQMRPSLSITYNSMINNGIAGYGWNIAGTSAISITNSTCYYDGINNIKPAKADKSSAYTLDGIRLIKLKESSTEITFQSEQGNIKVINYAPSGKYYFKVLYPDGRTAIYGNANTTMASITYPLTRMSNTLNEYTEYTYIQDCNYSYPDQITYGYGITQIGSVKFTYSSRTDFTPIYVDGKEIAVKRLLTKIETYQNTNLYRTYNLVHEAQSVSLLTKIECSTENEKLNPLTFSYGPEYDEAGKLEIEPSALILTKYFPNSKTTDLILAKARFDALDPSDGIINYPYFSPYNETGREYKSFLGIKTLTGIGYGSTYPEGQSLLVHRDLGLGSDPKVIQAEKGFQLLTACDIDGDGNDELVKVNYYFENDMGRVVLTTFDSQMRPNTQSFLIEGAYSYGSVRNAFPRFFRFGDFNGDGKIELLTIYGNRTPVHLANPSDTSADAIRDKSRGTLISLEGNMSILNEYFLPPIDYFSDKVYTIDFDGDGKSELCVLKNKELYIYSLSNNDFSLIYKGGNIPNNCEVFFSDINGDGKTDYIISGEYPYTYQTTRPVGVPEDCPICGASHEEFIPTSSYQEDNLIHECGLCAYRGDRCSICNETLVRGSDIGMGHNRYMCREHGEYITQSYTYEGRSSWSFLFSTGHSFTGYSSNITNLQHNNTKIIFYDINNDGLSDLLIKTNETISLYLNRQGKFNSSPEQTFLNVDKNAHFIEGSVSTIYSNQDNYHSQLLTVLNAKVTPISFSRNETRERLLTRFTNSMGIINDISYNNLQGQYIWSPNYTVPFPYNKLSLDLNVVNSIYTYKDYIAVGANAYSYNDAIIHRQGRGFCGFRKITTTDYINNQTTYQTFDPINFGVLKSIDSPTQATSYNYSVDVASNKIAKVLLINQTESDKLKDFSVKSTYEYDSYGNPTTVIVDYGLNLRSKTISKYNNLTGSVYRLGELTEQDVINLKITESSSSKTTIQYNGVRLPISKKSYYNNNQISEEIYSYNNDNRLISLKTKAYSSPNWFETQYTYTPLGQVLRTTDPMGFYTENTYTSKGLLESVKNHKGQATSYIYDNWGRLTQTSHPDGTTTSTSMSWVTTPLSVDALYMVTSSTTGQPTNNVYYDAVGREVRTSQVRFDGTELKTDKQYNTKGLLSQVSLPYKNNSPIWNTYTYDTYNRITEVNYTSGKKDVVLYNGAKVTSIQDGISSTKEYNVLGQLSSVTDEAGSIAYNYRADGQTSSIVAPGGYSTVGEIPLYSQLVDFIVDYFGVPELTITRLTHFRNDLGADEIDIAELVIQVEKEFSIEMNIDAMRILDGTEDIPTVDDFNILFANALGDIPIPQPISITTSFTYDNYGRQTSIIDPSAGTKSFVYDEAGNISSETDAEGRVTRMSYNNFNRITEKDVVGEKKSTYTYNADSLLISITSNDGTSTAYSYDQLGRVISEKETVLDNKWLQKDFVYNNGILSSLSYKSQSEDIATEHYTYTNGHLSEIKLNGTKSIFKLVSENDMGVAIGVTTGNLTRSYSFDQNGLPTERITKNGATVIQNFGYSIDPLTGNLAWRKDNIRNKQEDFGYDNLNRLISFGGNTITYDPKGNITENSSVGRFEYNHPDKPYALTDVTIYGEVIPMRNQQITYNGMMRPSSISENNYTATLAYGHSNNRIKMSLMLNNTDVLTRYYIGEQYEVDETLVGTKERLYLGGDAYSAAAVLVKENGVWNINYICRDYLGSITHVTDEVGIVKQELSYDPWGRLRNPETQQLYAVGNQPELLLGRGYTGHEHLPWFGLINMNARLYDPMLGRFLSPDPYVQAPDFSQNYNRYSYCLNNPLRYTDENGEFIFTLLCAIIPGAQPLIPAAMYLDAAWMGAAINVAVNWDDIKADGGWGSGKFWAYAGLGAVSGVGAASGNFWVAGATAALQSGGNTFVDNDYKYNSNVLENAFIGFASSVTVGFLTGPAGESFVKGTGGLDLTNKLSSTIQNLGFSQQTSMYAADFAISFGTEFSFKAGYYGAYKKNEDWFEDSMNDALQAATASAAMRRVRDISVNKALLNSSQNMRNNYNPSIFKGYGTPPPNTKIYQPTFPTIGPSPTPPPNHYLPRYDYDGPSKIGNNQKY